MCCKSLFHLQIREKINEGDVNIDADICALAEGPNNEAKRYKRYAMNGCRFHVKSVDIGSTYQNSSIFVQAGSNCYATAKDRQPRDDMLDYYGVLTDIIELDYHNGKKLLLSGPASNFTLKSEVSPARTTSKENLPKNSANLP